MVFSRRALHIAALSLFASTAPGAMAHETGLADIHQWRKERGITCMADHFHSGSGNGPTKVLAQRAAIADWASFTVFEYGAAWGNYQRAGSRSMNCSQVGAGWSCSVEARPCRTR